MKRFSRIFFYLRDQKSNIVLYFVFNFLSIVFSLVSLAMLGPFLQLLFGKDSDLVLVKPELSFSVNVLLQYLKYFLSQLIIQHHNNKMWALGAICLIVIISIFLKNLFYYLTLRVVSP